MIKTVFSSLELWWLTQSRSFSFFYVLSFPPPRQPRRSVSLSRRSFLQPWLSLRVAESSGRKFGRVARVRGTMR